MTKPKIIENVKNQQIYFSNNFIDIFYNLIMYDKSIVQIIFIT